jgi:hypothetical protein
MLATLLVFLFFLTTPPENGQQTLWKGIHDSLIRFFDPDLAIPQTIKET